MENIPPAVTSQTFNVDSAARLLGIGRSTAYECIRQGTCPVPVIHVGNRYLVPSAPLLRLLDTGTVRGTLETGD